MKKWKKIVLIVVGAVVAHFTLFFTVIMVSFWGDSIRLELHNSDLSGYKKTPMKGDIKPIQPEDYDKQTIVSDLRGCAIFPDALTSGNASMAYFVDPLFADYMYKRGQAYLEWSMDETTYHMEANRIKDTEGTWGKKPLRSHDLFPLFSYVSQYNNSGEFEYALLDDSSFTIRYIKMCDVGSMENVFFNTDFAPKKILKNSDIKDYVAPIGWFSIYSTNDFPVQPDEDEIISA
jgi:hypothetical protein